MTRYFLMILIISLSSCSLNSQNEFADWTLANTETIKHIDRGNQKIQVIYSILNTETLNFVDTSIVIQRYSDTLLLEEIQYNLEDGDSTKWSHKINRYNSDNVLIAEIDSVNGSLRHHRQHFYENGKITRSNFLTIIPDHNDMMELVGTDTMRSIVYNYYDKDDKCVRVMTLSKDELSSVLTRNTKYDTTLTFNQFDERGNRIQSLTTINSDTVSITRTEYDDLGRETRFIDASLEYGVITFKYEYDEQGNRTSELMSSDDFSELKIIEFDELDRPVTRKTYRPKTLANSGYE